MGFNAKSLTFVDDSLSSIRDKKALLLELKRFVMEIEDSKTRNNMLNHLYNILNPDDIKAFNNINI